ESDWLVPGVIHRGWGHKFGAREKIGKGTHVFYLLSRMERGEDSCYGPTQQATSLIYTEEPVDSVREKAHLFRLRRATIVHGFELAGLTWIEKCTALARAAVEDGHEVLFVDNLSRAAGVEDENGVELSRRYEELADVCKANGLTLIVDHHHKKGPGGVRDKARGGTAFAGAVDVNIEMQRVGGEGSRRRKLTAFGRLRATNWVRTIELSEDGRDYAELAEREHDDAAEPEVSAADQRAWGDLQTFESRASWTADEFGEALGVSRVTAQRRLTGLVEREFAVATDERRGRATVYRRRQG